MSITNASFVSEIPIEAALGQPIDALREHICHSKITVLRAPNYDVDSYAELMRRLGVPVHHVLAQFCLPQYREVLTISNLYRNGKAVGVHDGGSYWHTDMSYKQENTVFTSLRAVTIPAHGGGTEFIDCEMGLHLLCSAIKSGSVDQSLAEIALDFAVAIHRFGNREQFRNVKAPSQELSSIQKNELAADVKHPLVVRHPITGKKSLYAVAATAVQIEGFSEAVSQTLLDMMFDFLLQHAPRYVHHYQPGDIVVWDNLSTIHRGPIIDESEDENNCRLLHRINVNYMKNA